MDYLKTLVCIACLVFAPFASASYPAAVKDWCYSTSQTAKSCSGPVFDNPTAAAQYYCQTVVYYNKGIYSEIQVDSVSSNPAGMSPGLTNWGTFSSYFTCSAFNVDAQARVYTVRGQGSYYVQADAECSGGGSPINGYSPATCTGQPYTPPLACSATQGAIISAYHVAPSTSVGCYAGCAYSATATTIVEYNGSQYESGSWLGSGGACAATDVALTGGSPGNSQNVDTGGGGLVPGDLANLATEQTLQSVLQALQTGSGNSQALGLENKAILERIAASSDAIAANGASPTTVPDPDGLEAEYLAKLAANQVDQNGKLPDSVLGGTTVDVGSTFSNVEGFLTNRACPIPPQFNVMGRTYSMNIDIICNLAEAISYLVVALASISGVKIFIGGM